MGGGTTTPGDPRGAAGPRSAARRRGGCWESESMCPPPHPRSPDRPADRAACAQHRVSRPPAPPPPPPPRPRAFPRPPRFPSPGSGPCRGGGRGGGRGDGEEGGEEGEGGGEPYPERRRRGWRRRAAAAKARAAAARGSAPACSARGPRRPLRPRRYRGRGGGAGPAAGRGRREESGGACHVPLGVWARPGRARGRLRAEGGGWGGEEGHTHTPPTAAPPRRERVWAPQGTAGPRAGAQARDKAEPPRAGPGGLR